MWLQAIIAACSEEPAKKAKSPVHTPETLQRLSTQAPGDKAADETGSREKHPHSHAEPSDEHEPTKSLKSGGNNGEQNAVGREESGTSLSLKPGDTGIAAVQGSQPEVPAPVCESFERMLSPVPVPPFISSSRLPSKHHHRSGHPRRCPTPEGSGASPPNRQKGTAENSRADLAISQRQAAESQPVGFPTATRITATVAPSPVHFNMPVIVPQVSAANYYGSRQMHHAYYPYQGQNVFTYPVGSYMPPTKTYHPSTLASWSNMQEISQYSYQPVLAASLCPPSVGRGVQQQLQSSHMLRSCFTAQPQYQNLQPAHTSLALYPAAFGVIAPSAAVLPPSHIIDASAPRGYESRGFAATEKGSINVQMSLSGQSVASAVRPLSMPAARSKHQQTGTHVALGIQPAHMTYSSAANHMNSDSAVQVTAAVTDRRDSRVVTAMTPVTAAAAIIQPYGFYASSPPSSFGITNFAPGQIQSYPVGKCCSLIFFLFVLFLDDVELMVRRTSLLQVVIFVILNLN